MYRKLTFQELHDIWSRACQITRFAWVISEIVQLVRDLVRHSHQLPLCPQYSCMLFNVPILSLARATIRRIAKKATFPWQFADSEPLQLADTV